MSLEQSFAGLASGTGAMHICASVSTSLQDLSSDSEWCTKL